MTRFYDLILSHRDFFVWIGFLSLTFVILSIVLMPVIIISLPADAFSKVTAKGQNRFFQRKFQRLFLKALKNLLGGFLVIAGVIMLMIPGQGILTIIVGLWLMDFPGKKVVMRRFFGQKQVVRTINRFRKRFGRTPLQEP